jgi:hypothetical protein
VLRLYVTADTVAVAAHSMDELWVQPQLCHDLHFLDAVLLWVLFKVQVVEQTYSLPELLFVPIAQLFRKITHDRLHSNGVLNVKGLLVVLL